MDYRDKKIKKNKYTLLYLFLNSEKIIYNKLYTMEISANTLPDIKSKFDLDNNLNNLYHICIQYYTILKVKDHPMKKLITDIMDELIELKKNKDMDNNDKLNKYNEIHSIAYKNIQTIYDYDKEQDEKNGISSEVGNLNVKVVTENGNEKNDEKNDVQVLDVNECLESVKLDSECNVQ
jgi:hypothetical protein